jgi:hypothetical protein
VNKNSSGFRPATARVSSSIKDRGMGIDQRWRVLGVPNTVTPLTSVTDSATSMRRLSRLTRPTRRAASSPNRSPGKASTSITNR